MSSGSVNAHDLISNANTQTIGAFFSSLVTGIVIFSIQILLFNALKLYFPNIYRPRTFLVPEKERTPAPPAGLWRWILPIFKTADSEFIAKCGLDAYFFLRYLWVLLKIFLLLSLAILPILLPINATGGNNKLPGTNVKGLNVLSWGNVSSTHYHRYWAHLVIAVLVIGYICWNIFWELRNFIKVRQQYLTSPEHRLRASACTILVSGIPARWNNHQALDELFDVYPGGLKHIWINRDYTQLSDKVDLRDTLAKKLESAETSLVLNARQKHLETLKKEQKQSGKKKTKQEVNADNAAIDGAAEEIALAEGLSSGNPHQTSSLRGMLEKFAEESQQERERSPTRKHRLGLIGDGLGGLYRGVGEGVGGLYKGVGEGVGAVATGVGRLGQLGRRRGAARAGDGQVDGASDGDGQNPPSTGQREAAQEQERRLSRTSSTSDLPSAEKDKDEEKDDRTQPREKYPPAFDAEKADADETDAKWQAYLKQGDRDTMRLPLFGLSWMPFMPSWTFIGKKVDTIYYCRKELARLNLEIESDQRQPEKFPLMNSAFIQFNQQVAAHMAAQCVTHHAPAQMTPRVIEISPDDVLWDNLSLKWWERDLRGYGLTTLIIAMILFFIIPSGFVAGLSQLSTLVNTPGFTWVGRIPGFWQSVIQGVAPAALTALLFVLVPIVLKFLHNLGGAQTGNQVELTTQKSYFAFLFINLFLFVTIIGGSTTIISDLTKDIKDFANIPELLATNLPQASNYFFNYMILQALSISAGALAQVGKLIGWFILRPLLDTTPRQRWRRPINLPTVHWGKFFPVYTNFACIGIIYSVIAPLVMVFNIVIYGLFWIAYRYNTLYVNKFRFDSGGMVFPTAVKQLFTGLYVMEICLIGLFFLVRPPAGHKGTTLVCLPQAIIMIIVGVATVFFQYLIHRSFSAIYEFLPITLEDDAVRRDQEYAKLHARSWGINEGAEMDGERDGHADNKGEMDRTRSPPQRSRTPSRRQYGAEDIELEEIRRNSSGEQTLRGTSNEETPPRQTDSSDAPLAEGLKTPAGTQHAHGRSASDAFKPLNEKKEGSHEPPQAPRHPHAKHAAKTILHPPDSRTARQKRDLEAGDAITGVPLNPTDPKAVSSNEFFGAFSDEIQDLGPRERDLLIEHAFKHRALRARRPVIWIPQDDLGVSNDEIRRTHDISEWIWISNEGTAINSANKVLFKRPPPDFSEIDLIDV
ncbi:MAG: hypothetical protein Q9162_006526 [Coniocarpon cinnabarinum]